VRATLQDGVLYWLLPRMLARKAPYWPLPYRLGGTSIRMFTPRVTALLRAAAMLYVALMLTNAVLTLTPTVPVDVRETAPLVVDVKVTSAYREVPL
jgi:hypothetical protein